MNSFSRQKQGERRLHVRQVIFHLPVSGTVTKMKTSAGALSAFLMASLLGLGLHASVSAQPAPSRMQRCNADLALVTGDARKAQLSDCLRRRLDAERLVERECRSHIGSVPISKPAEKSKLQQECVARGLQVNYADLPRRPVAPPKQTTFTDQTDSPAATPTSPAPVSAPVGEPSQ